ncbi:MAG: DNA polymerase III subunit epsilon [Pseudorhodoplanes sp.]|nr:MAG: DNA polymerase III subunit epsilon [Pseudorhodoplanes sp.]
MREIIFDTETTGLDPAQGHRLIEIGCIELVNRFPTGKVFHRYFNPQRDVPAEAFAIHGLSTEFLKDHPLFESAVEEFLGFVEDAPLVAHNAFFDLGFINAELERAQRPPLGRERIIDTLMIARRRHPGAPNRLDDLCARYRIDNSHRTRHGALLDAELLAEVYVELIGARQAAFELADNAVAAPSPGTAVQARQRPVPLAARVSDAERAAHRAFIATLGEKTLWNDYLS